MTLATQIPREIAEAQAPTRAISRWTTACLFVLTAHCLTAANLAVAQTGYTHPNAIYNLWEYDMARSLGSPAGASQPWKGGFAQFRAEQPQAGHYGALLSALRWRLWDASDTAHPAAWYRTDSINAIDPLMGEPVGDNSSKRFTTLFRAPYILLAGDVLLYGGTWEASKYANFVSWIDNTVKRTALDEEWVNRTQEWPPNGQNHKSWAIYNLLLLAHVTHNANLFNSWMTQFLNFIDAGYTDPNQTNKVILPNGAIPNEMIRWRETSNPNTIGCGDGSNHFSRLSLDALIASARLIVNHGGPDLLTGNDVRAQRLRRAVQHLFYFASHPDELDDYYCCAGGGEQYCSNDTGSPGIETNDPMERSSTCTRVSALVEPLAGYYQNVEFAEYAARFRPNETEPTHTFPTMMYAQNGPYVNPAQITSPSRLAIHRFNSGDTNAFVPTAGNWRQENGVYRQYVDSNVDATAVAGNAQWMNYEFGARLRVLQFNASNLASVGLFARYVDDNNYYRFYYNKNANSLRIEQKANGVFTLLRSVSFTVQPSVDYLFKVVVNGPHLRFYVNGVLWLSEDNFAAIQEIPTATTQVQMRSRLRQDFGSWSGKVGLFAHRSDVTFDDAYVNSLPARDTSPACVNYAIVGFGSGRCLDVAAPVNGGAVTLYDCHGGSNQQWTHAGNGMLISAQSRRCLDIWGGRTDNGAPVTLYDCHGGANQIWEWTPERGLRNPASGRCLDVVNAGTANGSPLQIWDCAGANNQRWTPQ